MDSVVLKSPAKINLVLDVVRKRLDGFHDVDLVLQEIDLHDVVTVRSVDSGISIQCSRPDVPLNEKNLCYRAVQLVRKETGVSSGARIALQKTIPPSSGLGGGSSNAVAVLKALNALWKLNVSPLQLMDWSSRLGSDCAFFVRGKTQRARGRGELLEALSPCPELHLVLAFPAISLNEKTAMVYRKLDVASIPSHPSAEKMAIALQSKNPKSVADSAGNVFHYSKVHEYAPLMGKLAAWKQSKLVWNALMCGAGPTLMAICQSENSAKEFADSLKADSFWKHVMVSKTA